MKNEKKVRKFLNSIERTNRVFGLFLIVMGILFIAIPAQAAKFLIYMIATMLLARSVVFVINGIISKKPLEKVGFIINGIISITLLVLLFVLKDLEKEIIAIVMFAQTGMHLIECACDLIKYRKDKQKLIVGALNIVIYAILLVGLILEFNSDIEVHIVIYGTIFIVQGLVSIISSFNFVNGNNSFTKVILKSHTLEITSGLLVVVVGASILLPVCEPGIENFGDAVWYCFMLVTTIGFGDMTAITTVGRLISVFVGLYGIVVFALITSILVNLYNEKKIFDDKKQGK